MKAEIKDLGAPLGRMPRESKGLGAKTEGFLITFEGCDGSGKSTQLSLTAKYLSALGYDILVVREPGGDPIAENIRGMLLDSGNVIFPRSELLLFLAARAQVTDHVIKPALEKGEIVLCDRFFDSTVAYQGYGRECDPQLVRELNAYATNGLSPNLTLLFDMDPGLGLQRHANRNRMELEIYDFYIRVREGYLAEARLFPKRFRVVDASLSVDKVWLSVKKHLLSMEKRYEVCKGKH
jgi:dTMP kinase